jgi:uncharacterized protein (DUF2249 family)
MNSIDAIPSDKRFDAREIPCEIKHALIYEKWRLLEDGDFYVLINDHDPVPLHRQFDCHFAGRFTWEYLERGPNQFAVKLGKPAASPAGATAP